MVFTCFEQWTLMNMTLCKFPAPIFLATWSNFDHKAAPLGEFRNQQLLLQDETSNCSCLGWEWIIAHYLKDGSNMLFCPGFWLRFPKSNAVLGWCWSPYHLGLGNFCLFVELWFTWHLASPQAHFHEPFINKPNITKHIPDSQDKNLLSLDNAGRHWIIIWPFFDFDLGKPCYPPPWVTYEWQKWTPKSSENQWEML